MNILENKVAIVTGAGSGIGREIAVKYASEGAKVLVVDIDEPGGEITVNTIKKSGGEALFFKADTSTPEGNKNMVDAAVRQYGALHIAANNAGIGGPIGLTAEYPIDGWNK